MQFIDEVKIHVRAGDGGNGSVAFRREKFLPRGGPSGGDGGRGGSVILRADSQLATLIDLRYQQQYLAQRGEHGQGRDRYGKAGEDLVIRVPVGTIVRDLATKEVLMDLARGGAELVVARGGRGGYGNIHFATSTNQAPRHAEPGGVGEERDLHLELRVLADVGLVGYPNVGKSTFIARVSRARPKIADYPFTTLTPHLGVVGLSGERSFVVADIPGLIEGASDGHGLGHRFLRHIERTRVLVHILEKVDDPGREPLKDFEAIQHELGRYDPELLKRPQVVALGKIDLPDALAAYPALRDELLRRGIELRAISAVTGDGIGEILEEIWSLLAAAGQADAKGTG